MHASIAALSEDDAFALAAAAAFKVLVAGTDAFAGDGDDNVCDVDDCSLQPATNEASRTVTAYNSRWLLMGIERFPPDTQMIIGYGLD